MDMFPKELESKSSAKWLSEFPTDDTLVDMDGKAKRNQTTKFTGCSMPHIPTNISRESEKNKTYRGWINSLFFISNVIPFSFDTL